MKSYSDIGVLEINLSEVNNCCLARKQNEKTNTVTMFELSNDGRRQLKEMTLRKLLNYVNTEGSQINDNGETKFSEMRNNTDANYSPNSSETFTASAVTELRLRDLRRLDYQFNPKEEKSILIRRHAVLFAMDPLRAVILANKLIVIVAPDSQLLLNELASYMRDWAQDCATDDETDSAKSDISPTHSSPLLQPTYSTNTNSFLSTMNTISNKMSSTNRVKKSVSYGNLEAVAHNNAYNNRQDNNSNTSNKINNNSNRHNKSTNSGSGNITFESHAYEGLIATVRAYEARQYGEITAPLDELLQYYDKGYMLSIGVQERMRNLKNDLTVIINRVQSSRNALHELTEDDEDMALMNLTFLKEKPSLYAYPLVGEILSKHDEMEELLESHILDFNSLVANIEYARTKIENAEDLVSLRLDTARNELLIANTALAVLACSIGFSAYITGVFGMNLDNVEGIQEVKGIFSSVFVTTLILIPVLFIAICIYLKCSKVLPNGLSLQSDSKLHV